MLYAIKCDKTVTFSGGAMRLFDGFTVVKDGYITELTSRKPDDVPILDATGKTLTPGLIDAHTHLIHAGSREGELGMKLAGTPYMEILAQGGGILSTVAATRAASKDALKTKALTSLDIMLSYGTTTVEAKSGYGLDLDTELKQLEAARELGRQQPVDIISTYMGAHAIPAEYKGDRRGYLDLMTGVVIPAVAERNLVEFADVFCENGAFSIDETREILTAAKNLGFGLKLHADEIEAIGGAELAAELGAVSAEHLWAASEEGMDALAKKGVVAVLLPGTSFYLMAGRFANAKEMLRRGVKIALATDYNPGSCPTENMQMVMTFAAFGMGLSTAEILRAMTVDAAWAVGRNETVGDIKPGMKADLVIFNAPNPDYLIYHFGINHADRVIKNGVIVKGDKNIC